jgi:hypothetical protein
MFEFDIDGSVKKEPAGYVLQGKYHGQPFRMILVTHDESTQDVPSLCSGTDESQSR